jgi:ABC-type transport system involved in multi-copper enzyme maturation permease subunit
VNGTIIRALLQDALYQVLDNRIFRLLMLVVLGLVSPTFLVALRKDEVLILWGWQRISYDQLFDLLPVGPARQAFQDLQGEAIRFYESLIVNWLCGNIGMVFCVAATAFFVPRMLERGSADMLLSKPISRATLLLARYLSGILFVAILTSCLVLGMYLGFLTVSGYHDPGVLWGAVTLVYLFALVHGVTILCGVLTRSTVASTLIALVFFMGTGCVHKGWRIRSFIEDQEASQQLREVLESDREPDAPVNPMVDPDPSTFWKLALGTIDVMHYTLPKTSDAELITQHLRRTIERRGQILVDDIGRVSIPKPPDGFRLTTADLPKPEKGRVHVDLSAQSLAWALSEGAEIARIEVTRRSRLVERPAPGESGGRSRTRRLSGAAAAAEWTSRARTEGLLDSEVVERRFSVDGIPAIVIGWTEKSGDARRERQVGVLSVGDWIVEISETADPGWTTA